MSGLELINCCRPLGAEGLAHEEAEATASLFKALGDPARVRDEIARYRDTLGVTTLIVRVQWPGMDQARVLRTIRLLGEQVFPRLR